jgi:hypothetical protein
MVPNGSDAGSKLVRVCLAVGLLAALSCSGDGGAGGEPQAPVGPPPKDPMQIAQMDVPKGPPVQESGLDGALFPKPNATTFETAKALEGSESGNGSEHGVASSPSTAGPGLLTPPPSGQPLPAAGNPGSASDGPSGAAGVPAQMPVTTAPTTPGVNPSANAASDAMREIVEADIVQAQGDILYLLNRYRGLVLVDMSMPDAPFVRGRVPFQAEPVDMYLRNGKAYIVMSDYFTYWQFDSDSDPLGFHGSQLLVVDVVDPSHPAINGSFAVQGEVTDTRIVGDVLYAVSRRNPDYWRYDTQDWEDTSWVLSIDMHDPSAIRKVDEKEFRGAANLIQVYQTALSVAAIDPNYYLVDDDNARQTKITYVDISDPNGAIVVGGSAYVPGAVEDKFKMDLDKGQLRVISQDWYWQSATPGALTIFDATAPGQLRQRAQIPVANDAGSFNSPATPGATRFVGPDLFVNLCWYASVQVCRLDFYDLNNPDQPARVGMMPVDGAITHFESRGDRLLALGTYPNGNWGSQPQIALFNVADLRNVTRLSTVQLGDSGSNFGTSSIALQDYKAFKVLDDLQMILLPINWADQSTGQYVSKQGAQIVDWKNDVLTQRGRVAQDGYVERAIAFKNRVLSISTSQLQVIDATNRDLPVVTANLYLVRNVVDVFNVQGKQVQLAVAENDDTWRFFVLPFGEDDMAKSLVELPVDGYPVYQIRNGDFIAVVSMSKLDGSQSIRIADFTNPLQPRWRGLFRIDEDIDHIYSGTYRNYWSFYDYYWNPNAGEPLDSKYFPITARTVKGDPTGRRYYENTLRLIDLSNPDQPHLAQGALGMPDFPFVNKVSHGKVLYSTHTEPALDANGNPKKYHERYFVDRVDATDPNALKLLAKVNIPGRLVDVDAAGKLLYTIDYQWDEHGQRRNSFNVVRLDGDAATLVTVLEVGDEIARARYLDREVWFSTHSYPWYGRNDDSPDSRQPYTRLTRLRFDDQGNVATKDQHDVSGYHFDLLDVEGTKVYLASSYPTGLLILDAQDFANPMILGASRTIGYVSKLVREGDYLYLPMGSYGVRRVQGN